MKVSEFLRLLPIFEMPVDKDMGWENNAYRMMIPVQDFIDAMQRNGLEVTGKKSKINGWSIAEDLAKFSGFMGVDEAHDVIMGICKSKNMPYNEIKSKEITDKPLCHPNPPCGNCITDIDCGGKSEHQKKAIEDMYKYGLK